MDTIKVDIVDSLEDIEQEWRELIPPEYIYLSPDYLRALFSAPPQDYVHRLVVFRSNGVAVGGGLLQFVIFRTSEKLKYAFGPQWLKRMLNAVIVCFGNLTVTGDRHFYFSPHLHIDDKANMIRELIHSSLNHRTHQNLKPQLFLLKEIEIPQHRSKDHWLFQQLPSLKCHFVQPSMVLHIRPEWKTMEDYLFSLKSKYRIAFRRFRSKGRALVFSELDLQGIEQNRDLIHTMYKHTSSQAGFNSFELAENYFISLKSHLGNDFVCRIAMLEGEIVGFHSLIRRGDVLYAHFVGMHSGIRQNVHLYNNLLYDILNQGLSLKVREIHFGRTALESKSALGAIPVEYALASHHSRPILNMISECIFRWLYPGEQWKVRHPFRKGQISSPPSTSLS